MSGPGGARGALSRADLVSLLANPAVDTDQVTAHIAELLHLERRPRLAESARDPSGNRAPPSVGQAPSPLAAVPRILGYEASETPFWRLEGRDYTADIPAPAGPVARPYTGWRHRPPHPPVFHPLTTWAELAPRLRRVLSDDGEGRAIDLDVTVDRMSRGRTLERFPRERQRRWGPALMLIEDDSRRLIPYRTDRRLIRNALRRLLPGHALSRAVLREGMDRPHPLGVAAWPPPPGTRVLALGDLGCLAPQGQPLRDLWLGLGRDLLAAGAHPLVLSPGPVRRCPPELADLWRPIPWERPRETDGRGIEERAERLLRLVSPAARIEPGLLRAARLLLPPHQADAATEADVWQHPALIGDCAAAATIDLEQARGLRAAFDDEDPGLQRHLIRLIKAWRRDLPPEIWFDELLNAAPAARHGDGRAYEEDLDPDLEDARAYFHAFCTQVPVAHAGSMPANDRDWLDRIRIRSTDHLWNDPVVGARLAARAVELARHRQDPTPDGIRARQIDPTGLPERRWRLLQTGGRLMAVAPDTAPCPAGSPLADLTSRTGRIDIEILDEAADPNAFWVTGEPPPWADAWGWDDHGAWVAFSVQSQDGTKVSQRMRWIAPGRFLMGSPEDEPERFPNEGPQREVRIREGFWLFDTACTQALWQVAMGENPSRFKGLDRPVERVSWDHAQRFIQVMNRQVPGLALSLPSEAQWEYACRAGTATPFSFGANITPEQVNYDGEHPYAGGKKGAYRGETVPAGSLPANPWGLFEMHGNVWEWVQDAWHGNYAGAPVDGSAWEASDTGAGRVVRGGSWGAARGAAVARSAIGSGLAAATATGASVAPEFRSVRPVAWMERSGIQGQRSARTWRGPARGADQAGPRQVRRAQRAPGHRRPRSCTLTPPPRRRLRCPRPRESGFSPTASA